MVQTSWLFTSLYVTSGPLRPYESGAVPQIPKLFGDQRCHRLDFLAPCMSSSYQEIPQTPSKACEKVPAMYSPKSAMLNLHVDDIYEDSRLCHSAGVHDLSATQNDAPSSSFQSRNKKHVKLFEQYLLSCNSTTIQRILDPDPSRKFSERTKEKTSDCLPQSGMVWDSFLKKESSTEFLNPLAPYRLHPKGDNDCKMGTRSSTQSRKNNSRKVSVLAESVDPIPVQDAPVAHVCAESESKVYKVQVAAALSSGKAVWL